MFGEQSTCEVYARGYRERGNRVRMYSRTVRVAGAVAYVYILAIWPKNPKKEATP